MKVCVDMLIPSLIPLVDLRKILVNLVREKVSIKDIKFILENLCDFARFSKKQDILSERLRDALGRQICLRHATEDKILYAVTMSSKWEKILDELRQRTEIGTMFLLKPEQIQELIESTVFILNKISLLSDKIM